jgi:hypothetical protein
MSGVVASSAEPGGPANCHAVEFDIRRHYRQFVIEKLCSRMVIGKIPQRDPCFWANKSAPRIIVHLFAGEGADDLDAGLAIAEAVGLRDNLDAAIRHGAGAQVATTLCGPNPHLSRAGRFFACTAAAPQWTS